MWCEIFITCLKSLSVFLLHWTRICNVTESINQSLQRHYLWRTFGRLNTWCVLHESVLQFVPNLSERQRVNQTTEAETTHCLLGIYVCVCVCVVCVCVPFFRFSSPIIPQNPPIYMQKGPIRLLNLWTIGNIQRRWNITALNVLVKCSSKWKIKHVFMNCRLQRAPVLMTLEDR